MGACGQTSMCSYFSIFKPRADSGPAPPPPSLFWYQTSHFSKSNHRHYYTSMIKPKADRFRTGAKKKKLGFVFVNFDDYTQFYFDWLKSTICNKYIQYFSYKNTGYVWRSIKTNHSNALGPRSPRNIKILKIGDGYVIAANLTPEATRK